jgi:hypothetical protein
MNVCLWEIRIISYMLNLPQANVTPLDVNRDLILTKMVIVSERKKNMGKEYMSSSNAVIPIILVLSFLSTIGVIYGTLELSDDERNAWEVLKDLLSGKISLQDIWRVLSGRDAEAKAAGACQGVDQNGVYEYDKDGKCIKLGCKLGYYEQDNMCIERRNFSDEVFSGQTSADCELDPNEPYIYGQCLDKVTREPLTGLGSSCGTGIRSKRPNVINSAIGLDGACEESSEEVCSVPCPLECNAPESLWVPVEGAPCVGNGRHLGVPIDMDGGGQVTYHGGGLQLKKLLEISKIPGSLWGSTYNTAQDYADSINYEKCPSSAQKLCNVEPTQGSISAGCPSSSGEIGWIYHDDGAVFTKESVDAYMADASKYGELVKEPAVTRDEAIELGVLDDKGQPIDSTNMPKGYKIKYKAANTSRYEQTLEDNCTIIELEEAEAPRAAEDCVIVDETSDCYSVECGARYSKTVTPTVKKQAWGVGTCNSPAPYTRSCNTFELDCCSETNPSHFTEGSCDNGTKTFTQDTSKCITNEQIQDGSTDPLTYTKECCTQSDWSPVEGYDGCELIGNKWKRKYTREVTTGCEGDNAIEVKYQDDGDCCDRKGDWVIDGACSQYEENKQRYRQTTIGVCPPGADIKYEDCQNCILETTGQVKFVLGTRTICTRTGYCYDIPDCKRHKKYNVIQERIGTGTVPQSTGVCAEETVTSMKKQTCPEGYPLDVWDGSPDAVIFQFS